MSFDAPEQPTTPAAPPPPPSYAEQKGQAKKKGKSMQPTFLGTGSVPDVTNLGNKTLLGQ